MSYKLCIAISLLSSLIRSSKNFEFGLCIALEEAFSYLEHTKAKLIICYVHGLGHTCNNCVVG